MLGGPRPQSFEPESSPPQQVSVAEPFEPEADAPQEVFVAEPLANAIVVRVAARWLLDAGHSPARHGPLNTDNLQECFRNSRQVGHRFHRDGPRAFGLVNFVASSAHVRDAGASHWQRRRLSRLEGVVPDGRGTPTPTIPWSLCHIDKQGAGDPHLFERDPPRCVLHLSGVGAQDALVVDVMAQPHHVFLRAGLGVGLPSCDKYCTKVVLIFLCLEPRQQVSGQKNTSNFHIRKTKKLTRNLDHTHEEKKRKKKRKRKTK